MGCEIGRDPGNIGDAEMEDDKVDVGGLICVICGSITPGTPVVLTGVETGDGAGITTGVKTGDGAGITTGVKTGDGADVKTGDGAGGVRGLDGERCGRIREVGVNCGNMTDGTGVGSSGVFPFSSGDSTVSN